MRRGLLLAVIGLVGAVMLLEVLLRLFDPWGAVAYFTAGGPPITAYIPYGERYVLPAGEYSFLRWTAHITANHSRVVPDNAAGNCRIAFVGDSVTFGLGVDDGATWVNLVAAQHPAWDVVNASVPGYNSYGARLTIADTPADGYVYLISANDAETQAFFPDVKPREGYRFALQIYWRVWQIQRNGYEHPPQIIYGRRRFDTDLLVIARWPNVLVVGFAGDTLAESASAQVSSVVLLPHYSGRISIADPHPDAAGHQQIAMALGPHLEAIASSWCRE